MKILKITSFYLTLLTLLFFSCGSSEKVIMDNGSIYEVKGKKIFSNGEEVTETLTSQETKKVLQTLDQKLKAEAAAKLAEEKIQKAKEALEKAEKEKEELEKKAREKEEAREQFIKVKEELSSTKEKYKNLLDKGELSPKEIEKWEKRVKEANRKVTNAESNLKKY